MSLALKVLIGLIAGLAAGLAVQAVGAGAAGPLVAVLQPIGTIWVSAIRMAIIPLVVSALLLGVGGAPDARTVGILGARGLAMFVTILVAAGIFSLAIAPFVFAQFTVDPASADALRAGAVQAGASALEGAKQLPTVTQWLVDLVPVNPVKAMGTGED